MTLRRKPAKTKVSCSGLVNRAIAEAQQKEKEKTDEKARQEAEVKQYFEKHPDELGTCMEAEDDLPEGWLKKWITAAQDLPIQDDASKVSELMIRKFVGWSLEAVEETLEYVANTRKDSYHGLNTNDQVDYEKRLGFLKQFFTDLIKKKREAESYQAKLGTS